MATGLEYLRGIEPCSCREIVDKPSINHVFKAAALKVSPSIVSLITYNVPEDMIFRVHPGAPLIPFEITAPYVCPGSGIIIQCQQDAADGTYVSTILTPAHIFKRTNDLDPHEIKVDVHVCGGKLYEGQLLIYDFYLNLAAVTIRSDSPLQPAILRHVSDVDDDSNQQLQSDGKRPFKLQRQSYLNLFKLQSGTNLIIAQRSWVNPYQILPSTSVVFSTSCGSTMHLKELMSLKYSRHQCVRGGAIINYNGEVIGICFSSASFLPINLVSRWWDHYKNSGQLLRPCVAVEVANLQNQLVGKSPNIVRGVVVTEVEENSPLKRHDVIIGCDGNTIGSKLEFFERIWDNAGRVVKLNVLRASDDYRSKNISLTIGDIAPDESYKWKIPECWEMMGSIA